MALHRSQLKTTALHHWSHLHHQQPFQHKVQALSHPALKIQSLMQQAQAVNHQCQQQAVGNYAPTY